MKAKIYMVVHSFADSQDGMYIYRVGDIYPRMGHMPTEDRIKVLLSKDNAYNEPLIKAAQVKEEEEEPKYRKQRRKKG